MSSEYGWTDEQIGDLPLSRFRQITAAIQLRRFSAIREENSRISWLARHLAGFIAAGYMVDSGSENTALAKAQTLAFDDIEQALLGGTNTEAPQSGDNRTGSFEKLMQFSGRMGGSPT